jgi:hypothetical protein
LQVGKIQVSGMNCKSYYSGYCKQICGQYGEIVDRIKEMTDD